MRKSIVVLVCCFVFVPNVAHASGWRKNSNELALLNLTLQGKVIDHTANSGRDLRIWSRSMAQKRDLYVYLPPKFDPHLRYPVMLWLHGLYQDEQQFLDVVRWIDKAIHECKLPPIIVAAPDGSVSGEPTTHQPGTFFLNTELGDFEDFLVNDVWDFVVSHYPIRPEREAHILAGYSMGGFSAFNLGIRHRCAFGVAIGFAAPLNLRWMDFEGDAEADFDPNRWGWRTSVQRSHEAAGRFFGGLVPVRVQKLVYPLFGKGDDAMMQISCNNPIELMDRTKLRNGELQMYIAYGRHDEFNIDAQVESFLYLAKCRGICVGVGYDPDGRHDIRTANRLFPGMIEWLAPRLAPYGPHACPQPVLVYGHPSPGHPHVAGPPSVSNKLAPTSERPPAPPKKEVDRGWEPVPPPREPPPPPDRRDLGPDPGPPVGDSPFDRPLPTVLPPSPAPTFAPPPTGTPAPPGTPSGPNQRGRSLFFPFR